MSQGTLLACGSSQPYRDCCQPLHRKLRPPLDAPTLVRARFCAFARKELSYLWDTLHPHHPDRQRDPQQVLRELRATCQQFRFVRLHLLAQREEQAHAQVLFWPEIFEKGKDRSFVELSDFERVEGGWAYRRGELLPRHELPVHPSELTLEVFARLRSERANSSKDSV